MGELILVRHGQANSGAKTEEDYDRLSDLGHAQAKLLGAWMGAHEDPFDLTLCGTMRRHRETAAGMGVSPDTFDDRLNEMEYFALIRDMEVHHDVSPPKSPEDFAVHMPQTLAAWNRPRSTDQNPSPHSNPAFCPLWQRPRTGKTYTLRHIRRCYFNGNAGGLGPKHASNGACSVAHLQFIIAQIPHPP